MSRLDEKVAIVSGGARGIGAATAARLCREGARVVIGDVLEADGHATAAKLGEQGHDICFVKLDVTSEQSWQSALETCIERFGSPDVLVNNAGAFSKQMPLHEEDIADWERVLAVNITGPFLGMRTVIPLMQANRRGSVINISSGWGVVAVPTMASYHTSKGAVLSLTRNAAVTYGRDGIRVNAIMPGNVDKRPPGEIETNPLRTGHIPLGRHAVPADIAATVVYLASEDSAFVTGTAVTVDGGYLALGGLPDA